MRPSFALPFALLSLLSAAAPPNKNNLKDYSTPYSQVLTGDTFKGATATGTWSVSPPLPPTFQQLMSFQVH